MPVEEMPGPFFVKLLEKTVLWLTELSLPMIASYHLFVENTLINETSYEPTAFEKVADTTLIPFHYIFGGKSRTPEGKQQQRFDYDTHLLVKSSLALLALPLSTAAGVPLKIAAALSHNKDSHPLQAVQNEPRFASSTEAAAPSPLYARRPGDENHLREEKAALKEIIQLFKTHQVPYWVDCGTCLGVYRHRGAIPWDVDIDVAILEKDHDLAKQVLKTLDPKKYQVQDWSNRSRPGTYLRLYVKASKTHIDIYHFAIDEENQMLRYISSNDVSAFVLNSWKINEQRYKIPTPISTVFPLRPAIFDGIEVLVPNKTKEYLQLRYGQDLSPVRIFNEKTGTYEKNLDHPYWKLSSE